MYYLNRLLFQLQSGWWLAIWAIALPPALYMMNWRILRRRIVGRTVLACTVAGLVIVGAALTVLPLRRPRVQPVSVTLSGALLRDTYEVCERYDVPFDVLLAIMYHESRFQLDITDNLNQNGTLDRGLCQINEVNWSWLLEEHGLDVSKPRDNIEAAALLLSRYLNKYTLEQSLAAYAAGVRGMKRGGGIAFAQEVLAVCDAGLQYPPGTLFV